MPHHKLNQNGFSGFEAILILVILSMIGGTGFYVYSSSKKANKSLDSASASDQVTKKEKRAAEPQKVDETTKWLEYKAPSNAYILHIPDGWQLQRYQTGDSIYAFDASNINFKAGQLAEINQVEFGRDFESIAYNFYYGDTAEFEMPGATPVQGFKTNQGLEFSKFKSYQSTEPEGLGAPKGTTSYFYIATKNNKKVRIQHDVLPGEVDKTSLIEQSLRTLNLN